MGGSLVIIFGALQITRNDVSRLSSFYRLVLWLAVSDFFASVGSMFGAPEDDTLCGVQAVLLSFFELAGILWSAAIANTIHCTIRRVQQVERRELENVQNRRSGSHPQQSLIDTEYALDICIADLGQGVWATKPLVLHLCVWVPSLVLTVLPWAIPPGYYGRADGWCWVVSDRSAGKEYSDRNEDAAQTLRMAQYYVPLYVALVYNLIVCILVWRQLTKYRSISGSRPRAGSDARTGESSTMLYNLLGFPFVLVFTGTAATVMRCEEIFRGEEPELWLVAVCGSTLALHGFLDAAVYTYPKSIRQELIQLLTFRGRTEDEGYENLMDQALSNVEVPD